MLALCSKGVQHVRIFKQHLIALHTSYCTGFCKKLMLRAGSGKRCLFKTWESDRNSTVVPFDQNKGQAATDDEMRPWVHGQVSKVLPGLIHSLLDLRQVYMPDEICATSRYLQNETPKGTHSD